MREKSWAYVLCHTSVSTMHNDLSFQFLLSKQTLELKVWLLPVLTDCKSQHQLKCYHWSIKVKANRPSSWKWKAFCDFVQVKRQWNAYVVPVNSTASGDCHEVLETPLFSLSILLWIAIIINFFFHLNILELLEWRVFFTKRWCSFLYI